MKRSLFNSHIGSDKPLHSALLHHAQAGPHHVLTRVLALLVLVATLMGAGCKQSATRTGASTGPDISVLFTSKKPMLHLFYLDISPSDTSDPTIVAHYIRDAATQAVQSLDKEPAGSAVYIYATSSVVAYPREVLIYHRESGSRADQVAAMNRFRSQVTEAVQAAIQNRGDVKSSPIIEDTYTLLYRNSLNQQRYTLTIYSDMRQWSSFLTTAQIITAPSPGDVISTTLQHYPKLEHSPTALSVVFVPPGPNDPQLTGAQEETLKGFWLGLLNAWGQTPQSSSIQLDSTISKGN